MLKIEGLEKSSSGDTSKDWLAQFNEQEPALTITQITSGVRDPNRVNVFINGRYTLSLDIRQVVDLHIKVGRKLSQDELQDLHKASEFGKLYKRALEWALSRPHSIWETREYLRRRQLHRIQNNRKRLQDELKPLPEIQDETISLVLDRLIEKGYVNDRTFAKYYVENRFVKKGISQKRLELELRKKQVPDSIIKDVLSSSTRDEKTELLKIIQKKRHKYDNQKLISYLVRQGFKYDLVKEIVLSEDNSLY